jgi:uncharacterized protein with ParB-like and HNH nuclease domain
MALKEKNYDIEVKMMKASQLQIINFLQTPRVQFVIPVYQRNYDWTTGESREG